MEKKIPYELKIPVIYVIKDGEVVYDYDEMASHFSHQLWMLNKDDDIDLNISTQGFDDSQFSN